MRVHRETFLNALEMVSPGLSQRDVLEQSGCFVFQDEKVYTFNDETACSFKSPLEGIKGAVQSEPLKAILHKLKDEQIEVSQNESEMVIRAKRQSSGIRMEQKIELPIDNLESPTKWKVLPSKFAEAVELVEGCASRDEAHFFLTCIHLHPKWIEAYDNYQFARYRIALPLDGDTLVKQLSLKNIVKMGMTEFSESDHWLHFRNADKLMLSCRRYMDKYRNCNSIAKIKGQRISLPKSLIEVTGRAEVFSVTDPNKENQIRIDLKPSLCIVRGEGQYGWYRGQRKIKYDGPELSFMVKPQMIAELVKRHTECEICENALKAEVGNFVFVTSLASTKSVDRMEKKEKK